MAGNNLYRDFANQSRAVIVAPAGCGKTELIARATGCCNSRQLILTHTHAGVDSLRARFRKLGISSSDYHVETIHSFALRYASAYPRSSSIKNIKPEKTEDYIDIIESANRFIETTLARDILKNSYGGVFVDEYQDCIVEQHKLIIRIANVLPCRIVGDPLQGIFDFGENEIVDWEKHVFANFTRMDDLSEPWRWKDNNPRLGDWLKDEVRTKLLNDQPVSLKELPVDCLWERYSDTNLISILNQSLSHDGTTFAICDPKIPIKPHTIAKKLKNRYKSIEPVTSDEIYNLASNIENSTGIERLKASFEFAKECLTFGLIGRDYGDVLRVIEGDSITLRASRKKRLLELAKAAVTKTSLNPIVALYNYLQSEYETTIFRHQLWYEMKVGLLEVISENIPSLREATWHIRNRARIIGRRMPKRCVSRTILLKGLECDHSIVVDADSLDSKNLYVCPTSIINSL